MNKPKSIRAAAKPTLTLALLLSIAGFLAGCGGDGSGLSPESSARIDLLENRAKWETNAPEDFSYTLRRSCFCEPGGPWRIYYADGLFQQLLDLDGNESDINQWEIPETAEDMFNLLDQAYDHETAEVMVQYHPEFGLPTLVNISWLPGAQDDGVAYYVSDIALPGTETDAFYQARLAWSTLASPSYEYRLEIHCECIISGPVDVVVEQGVVTSAVLEGQGALTQEQIDETPLTIEQLFDMIATLRESESNQVAVTYADSGYPTRIVINEDQIPVDGGAIYSVSMFSPR